MHTFTGRNARLFSIGEPYKFFDLPLEDLGTGWDWMASGGVRWWDGELLFEVWEGGSWEPISPLIVYPRTGGVSFDRNLGGKYVRASGVGCPTSPVVEADSWKLEVESVVRISTALGSDAVQSEGKTLGATAVITDVLVPEQEKVLAWLPFSVSGVFVGLGRLVSGLAGASVIFNDEGVRYESV